MAYEATMTNVGRNKEAAALANKTALNITHMAWGDGSRTLSGGETALLNEQGRKLIQGSSTVQGNLNAVFFEILLDQNEGPFIIRECGLFDADGDMIAVARYEPPINKVKGQSSALLRMNIVFSDLQNLVLQVSSTDAYVPVERVISAGAGLWGGGDLSENRKLSVRFATQEEALAGEHAQRVMSPALVAGYIEGKVAPEIDKLKTPALASVANHALIDAITTTSTRIAPQGALAPLFPFGGLVEHTEFGDGSARQVFSHETSAGVFLGRYFRRRLTGAWGAWRGDGVTTWPTGQPLPSQDIGTIYSDTYLTTLTHRTVTGFGPAYTGYASSHVGEGFDWSDATAPPNALAREGGNVSRTTYAALFAILGERFGAGDGSTTFGLPETRGEFLRGWDNGRGVDAGRVIGSWQQGSATGGYSSGANGSRVYTHVLHADGDISQDTTGMHLDQGSTPAAPSWLKRFLTRPRNIALMFCIKY